MSKAKMQGEMSKIKMMQMRQTLMDCKEKMTKIINDCGDYDLFGYSVVGSIGAARKALGRALEDIEKYHSHDSAPVAQSVADTEPQEPDQPTEHEEIKPSRKKKSSGMICQGSRKLVLYTVGENSDKGVCSACCSVVDLKSEGIADDH